MEEACSSLCCLTVLINKVMLRIGSLRGPELGKALHKVEAAGRANLPLRPHDPADPMTFFWEDSGRY